MLESKSTLKLKLVGEQVAAARRLLKMSQRELIAASGISKTTVVNFENGGEVRAETMEAIREVLVERGIVFTNGDRPGCYIDKERAIR